MKEKSRSIFLAYHGKPAKDLHSESLPLGLLFVGSALANSGYDVKLFHLLGDDDDRLVRAVKESPPLFVGFSTFASPFLKNSYKDSKIISGLGVPVVWGGIFASSIPEQVLKSEYVDYVVLGEGERTAVHLADALSSGSSVSGIKGVGWTDKGVPVIEPLPPLEENIDNFELRLDLLPIGQYLAATPFCDKPLISIPFSRGCPYSCHFCYNSMNEDRRKWRVHSAEYLSDIVKRLEKNYGAQAYALIGDNLFGKADKAREIISQLDISWKGSCHLHPVSGDFLDWAIDSGCFNMTFGIESGSDRVLKEMQKGITSDIIRDKMELCRQRKLRGYSTFIIMVPDETPEEMRKTLALMDELFEADPYRGASLNIFNALPKTSYWRKSLDLGLKAPENLEQWVVFNGSIHQFLGYSGEQCAWIYYLGHMLYTETPEFTPIKNGFLRYALRKVFLNSPAGKIETSAMNWGRKFIKTLKT